MTSRILGALSVPIISAPMAGGPSTPEMAIAVSRSGGLGMLAGALLDIDRFAAQVAEMREVLFGVNLFLPDDPTGADVDAYARRITPWLDKYNVEPGVLPRRDDFYPEKFNWLVDNPVPVVSSTFGTFSAAEVAALHEVGTEVWCTVTSAEEAIEADANGVDALVVQGPEAGGHRGSFDGSAPDAPLADVLAAVRAVSELPRIAAGGLMDGTDVAPLLQSGAAHAAQLGTAFLNTAEAGTRQVHREQLTSTPETAVTRAFSGRPARGIVNEFMRDNSEDAPLAYPDVHYLTAPMRAEAGKAGDAAALSMWAGTGHLRTREATVSELMAEWADQLEHRR